METFYMITNKNGDSISDYFKKTTLMMESIASKTGFILRKHDKIIMHLDDLLLIGNGGEEVSELLGFTTRDDIFVQEVTIDFRNDEFLNIDISIGKN